MQPLSPAIDFSSFNRTNSGGKYILSPLNSRSVTVVIPTFNEEGNLDKLFEYIQQAFDALGYALPVLVVNDGSTDATPDILRQLQTRYDFLTVVHHPQCRGVAQVWVTALRHVTTDWIFWGQADLESDPRTDIPALLNAYQPGVGAIAGWRQARGDGKVLASSVANVACRIVFGSPIHDMNWIKLVRTDLLAPLPIPLITHRYLLPVVSAQGHTVIETPTPWHARYSGSSKFGRKRLLTSAKDFLRVASWFYILQPIHAIHHYVAALPKALEVGLIAAKRAWLLELQATPGPSPGRSAPVPSTDDNSTIQAMARHLQLAATKVNPSLVYTRS